MGFGIHIAQFKAVDKYLGKDDRKLLLTADKFERQNYEHQELVGSVPRLPDLTSFVSERIPICHE